MSISKEQEVFKKSQLFSKDDILISFNSVMDDLNYEENTDYSGGMKKIVLQLCEQFKKSVSKAQLPKVTDNWCYKYEFTYDSIKLILCSCDNIEIDKDGELSSMTVTNEYELICVQCDYLSVEQYAKIQNVLPGTVRQWIRRGKLRGAKKKDRDWSIPTLQKKPARGYESVEYSFETLPENIYINFPYLRMSKSIRICQDNSNKSNFLCVLNNFAERTVMSVELTKPEVEKLELLLISSGVVTPNDCFQWIPNIR